MKPEFHGTITVDGWTMHSPKVFAAYVAGQKPGKYYLTLTKVKGPPKTAEQLGYYYAVVLPTAYKQMLEDGNDTIIVQIGDKQKEVPLTEDVVDGVLKAACAKFNGQNVKDKRNMTKEDAAVFLGDTIRWCARYLHCVIPEPER